jgi:hypothetical protein
MKDEEAQSTGTPLYLPGVKKISTGKCGATDVPRSARTCFPFFELGGGAQIMSELSKHPELLPNAVRDRPLFRKS